jgi:hypothetical protein
VAAAPASAGLLYVPTAFSVNDGDTLRRTELLVTNPSDTAVLGFFARFLPALTDGTQRAGLPEPPVYFIAPGQSARFSDLIPAGQRGLLEIEGSPELVVSARLVSDVVGFNDDPEPVDLPVLSSKNAVAANGSIWLQGLEKEGSLRRSNLGVVNLGFAAATCSLDIRQVDGLLVLQNVTFPLPPLSQVQYDDAFGLLGLNSVPEGARVRISCNQTFWAFTSTYDDRTGAAHFVGPSATVSESSLAKPVPPDPGGGGGGGGGGEEPTDPDAVVFRLNGEFLKSNSSNTNWRYTMHFGAVKNFKKIVIDFDLFVSGFDPHLSSGFHCIFWLNNGSSWNNMLGYLNSRGTKGTTVFQVNSTGGGWIERSQNKTVQPGNNYHVNYTYDTVGDTVSYEIRQGSSVRVGTEYDINVGTININSAFIEFGTQVAPEGPEATTYGWRFSNYVAHFIPSRPRPPAASEKGGLTAALLVSRSRSSLARRSGAGRPGTAQRLIARRQISAQSAPKSRPATWADCGSSEPEVMPGRVLASRTWGWPPASSRKSTREKSRSSSAPWVASASSRIASASASGISAGKTSRHIPGVYLHS